MKIYVLRLFWRPLFKGIHKGLKCYVPRVAQYLSQTQHNNNATLDGNLVLERIKHFMETRSKTKFAKTMELKEANSDLTNLTGALQGPISETESACLLISTSDCATGDVGYLLWRTKIHIFQ